MASTEKDKDQGYTFFRDRILRAPAIAVPPKWVEITGEIGRGVQLYGIFEDPDHADLVCLRGNAIRDYVIHAKDKNYTWDMTTAWDLRKQPETDESFLRHASRRPAHSDRRARQLAPDRARRGTLHKRNSHIK